MAVKPFIASMINTCALALTAAGTNFALQLNFYGLILIAFGILIEWIKYVGMKKKIW